MGQRLLRNVWAYSRGAGRARVRWVGRKRPDTRSRWFAFTIWICSGLTYGRLGVLSGVLCGDSNGGSHPCVRWSLPPLAQKFVPATIKLGTRVLKHFPGARLTVDATPLEMDKPGGRTEAALHRSGRHQVRDQAPSPGKCGWPVRPHAGITSGKLPRQEVWGSSGAETLCRPQSVETSPESSGTSSF